MRRACSSAVSARMRSALVRNSAAFLSIDDARIANVSSTIVPKGALAEHGRQWRSGLNAIFAHTEPIVRLVVLFGGSRHRRESRGIQRRHPVRKAKLLSTVAAALLLSAGAATAQGMNKDTPERAPAAQQSAPAEKVAPAIKAKRKRRRSTPARPRPTSSLTRPKKRPVRRRSRTLPKRRKHRPGQWTRTPSRTPIPSRAPPMANPIMVQRRNRRKRRRSRTVPPRAKVRVVRQNFRPSSAQRSPQSSDSRRWNGQLLMCR